MDKFTSHTGVGVPLRRSNVDTDQIIPAVYLKRVTRTGFEDGLFAAWRNDPEFVLNKDVYKNASVLVAGIDFGTGYPRGLKGDTIPLEGRITAIADNFDALTTQRVYKPAYDFDHAKELMLKERGKHFDPELLDIFFDSMEEITRIYDQFADPTWLSTSRHRAITQDQGEVA